MSVKVGSPDKTEANRKYQLLNRFRKNHDGSVAIEVSLLLLPFFLLVFAIIEACVAFGAQQVMANAVDDVARDFRTNKINLATVTPQSLKDNICSRMGLLFPSNCPDLIVDLKEYPSYASIPTTIPRNGTGDVDSAEFVATPGGITNPHHLRVFYRWTYYTDFIGNKLADLPDNKTLFYFSATYRMEPPT